MSRSTKRAYPKLCHEKRREKESGNKLVNNLLNYFKRTYGTGGRALSKKFLRVSFKPKKKKKKMGKNNSLLHINFLVKRNIIIYRRLSKFLRLQPTQEKFAFKCFLQEVAIEVVESRDSVQERKNSWIYLERKWCKYYSYYRWQKIT